MKKKDNLKLTSSDRMTIQACLHNQMNITQIANRLNKHKSTISRELQRNQITKIRSSVPCDKLKKLIVCNTCKKKAHCNQTKHYYDYERAIDLATNRLSLSRSSSKVSEANIKVIDEIVSQGVILGQSIHHIFVSNPVLSSICCERTIRRLIYRGNLSVKPHQLRRYTRFKHPLPKEQKSALQIRDIRMLMGRTYQDYKRCSSSNKRLSTAQYDSVIGKISDKKALLTITLPKFNFQFGLLIQKGSPVSCTNELKKLFKKVGNDIAEKVFQLNLCDNGTEFSSFYQIEADEKGQKVRRTFYTNPFKATDKAHCERNHSLVRYFLPKGKSLDNLTQEMVDNLFSHLNSYIRQSKNNCTPYDLVKKKYGEQFLNAINIQRIPNKKVKLIPII